MSHDLPDDWYEEHDGQRLVLSSEKVAAEIGRLNREVMRLEGFIAMWRKHSYELGKLIDPGQPTKHP